MATRLRPLLAVLLLPACSRPTDDGAPAAADTAPAAAPVAWEGRYRLVTADGDSLPSRLDHPPNCSSMLVYGALTLQGNRFYFTDTVRERCAGRTTRQESRIAEGAYEAAGETLRFQPDSAAAFGAAEGIFGGDWIRLLRLRDDAGTQDVDWLFVRRDRTGR